MKKQSSTFCPARPALVSTLNSQLPTLNRPTLPPASRAAFERLDAALRENAGSSNARKIAILRKFAFAEVEALEASGEVIIPKWEP